MNEMEAAMHKVGALVKREAIRRCPVDTGDLRRHIGYRLEPEAIVLFCDSQIAEYVEFGTGKWHLDREGQSDPRPGWDIVPVNATVLAWEKGKKARLVAGGSPATAEMIFAKKVHQEGTHAQPFLRPAIFQNIPEIQQILVEGIRRSVQ